MKNNFFSKRAVRHWQRLPRAVGESPSTEVLKDSGVVALGVAVSLHSGGGLELDSMILMNPFQLGITLQSEVFPGCPVLGAELRAAHAGAGHPLHITSSLSGPSAGR